MQKPQDEAIKLAEELREYVVKKEMSAAETDGMFEWLTDKNYLNDKGKAVGSQVTRKKAVAAKRASSCWVGYNPVSNGGTDSPTENSMTIRLSTVKDKDMSGKTTKSILSWARPMATVKGQLMEKPSSKFLSASKGRILVNGDLACG